MSEQDNKLKDLAVEEEQDGSAVINLPSDMMAEDDNTHKDDAVEQKSDGGAVNDDDTDHPDDDEELRAAKRNRRRAKKDLIRKTNQEKDLRLTQLQRENAEFKQRLMQLERNTKSADLLRIEKGIEDAQTKLEYAKMKLAEATQNQDGQAMVEAQTLWQSAQEEARNLHIAKNHLEQELRRPQRNENLPDPEVQRLAAQWMSKNSWYNPAATDKDSRIAKKIDELMSTKGWNPTDPDYWEELDSRLQKELPHRYNSNHVEENSHNDVKKPRNVAGSAGREASFGAPNRSQFVLSPERVKAMKEAGVWDNPERKAKMIQQFINYDRNKRN